MANSLPAAVIARQQASGGPAAVSLLDVQTLTGLQFSWADQAISAPPAIPHLVRSSTGFGMIAINPVSYLPWLLAAGPFVINKSTKASSGSVRVQNISGDTVQRDTSLLLSRNQLVGAIVCFRSWLPDCEFADFTFNGRIVGAPLKAQGDSLTLQFEGLDAWASVRAPYKQIGPNCPNTFGSVECGSTAATPCNNDYGSCTSTNRFEGAVQEWTGATIDPTQYVQPQPLRIINGRLPG